MTFLKKEKYHIMIYIKKTEIYSTMVHSDLERLNVICDKFGGITII